MRNLILLVAIFVLSSVTLKQCEISNNEDRILWTKNKKLTWKDYKGKVVKDDSFSARTFCRIRTQSDTVTETSVVLLVTCEFNRKVSWSKSKSKKESSQWLLEHEQLHFDIAELIARKIRKEYSSYKWYNNEDSNNFLQSTFDKYYNGELLEINTAYDEETNHGTIRNKQKDWEDKIKKELYKLRKFSDTKVKVRRITVLDD